MIITIYFLKSEGKKDQKCQMVGAGVQGRVVNLQYLIRWLEQSS